MRNRLLTFLLGRLRRMGMTVFAWCLVTSLLGNYAAAQFAFQVQAGGQVDQTKLQREQFESQIRIRIDEIRRDCNLSDEQIKRLEVGGKGAVGRAMSKYRKKAKELQAQLGGRIQIFGNMPNAGNDNDDDDKAAGDELDDELEDGADLDGDESDEDADEQEDEEEGPGPPLPPQIAAMISPNDISPEDETVWRNTLKNVLTDEQKKTLEASDQARRAYNRMLGVRQKVGELDLFLRLSADQREKMIEVVDEVLGGTFENPQRGGTSVVVAIGDSAQLRKKHVREILSPTQLEAFQKMNKQFAAGAMPIQVNIARVQRVLPAGMQNSKVLFGVALSAQLGQDIRVDQVVPGSPAEEAGVQVGDKILGLNDKPIKHAAEFFMHVAKMKPGDTAKLKVDRRGDEVEMDVTVVEREKDE